MCNLLEPPPEQARGLLLQKPVQRESFPVSLAHFMIIHFIELTNGVEIWVQGCEKKLAMKAIRRRMDRQITPNDRFKVEQQTWKGVPWRCA